ncbi:MAG TPA: hypothetical protein VIY49_30960 [Bryobacteraceae bacterium]
MKNTNGLVSTSLMVFGLLIGVKSVTAANTAGTLDATFGTGGVTVANVGGIGGIAASIVVQSNGGILAFIQAGSTSAEVLRFTASGALDTTFGSNGIAAVPVSIIGTMALESNGQIVVGGVIIPSGGGAELGAVRLNANGTVDTTFRKRRSSEHQSGQQGALRRECHARRTYRRRLDRCAA